MKAMGALAGAACASFLVEAFHSSFFGNVLNIEFLKKVGDANGSLGGVAAAILVPLALGVSPVYSVLIGLSCSCLLYTSYRAINQNTVIKLINIFRELLDFK